MILDTLTLEDCELVRRWRNQCLETLRTPYGLSKEQQAGFYHDQTFNKYFARYWAVREEIKTVHPDVDSDLHGTELVGMGGLQNIEWENRRAEISLIIDPIYWGKGFGRKAVDLILAQGFNYMGLANVWGEFYDTNAKSAGFWQKIIKKYKGYTVLHPNIKFWNNIYYSGFWFQIGRHEFNKEK